MYLTRDVEFKFNLTRQTLSNYIRKGVIDAPIKDNLGRHIWEEKNIKQLENYIKTKSKEVFESQYINIQNRRYLGSKQKILDFILKVVEENTINVNIVADIFAGTGVVANMFNELNKKVIVNDILYSNYVCYEAWFGNECVDYLKINNIIDKLNKLSGKSGYVDKYFGNRYFTKENAQKIDSIREEICEIVNINTREKSIILTSLLYAMDKVANTVGHYDAYRKKIDNVAPIVLKIPKKNNNNDNEIYNMDANQLVKNIYADLVYIDTPYNSRGYENAYHVLENIIEWKKPEVEGIAKKAVNRKEKTSEYTKSKAKFAFENLIENINSRYILVSYNNMEKKGNSRSNAKISGIEIIEILKKRGSVKVFEIDFNPFTTGKSKIKNHKELLYLCEVYND